MGNGLDALVAADAGVGAFEEACDGSRGGNGLTAAEWLPPRGVVVAELDRSTGKLSEAATPPEQRYMEYFVAGTEPGARRVDARRFFRFGPLF